MSSHSWSPTSEHAVDLRRCSIQDPDWYAWQSVVGNTHNREKHTDVAPSAKSTSQTDSPGLLNATNAQQGTVTDFSFNSATNPGPLGSLDGCTQFNTGYLLTQAYPFDYGSEFALPQFPSAPFRYNSGAPQDGSGRLAADPYNGAVGFVPQTVLQQDTPNALSFQAPFDTLTVGDDNGWLGLQPAVSAVSGQPGPALSPLTRHQHGPGAPIGKTGSQEKSNRIKCTHAGCHKTFGRPAEFRRHLDTKHQRNGAVRCMLCTYEYPRLDKVRSHMEKMHGLRVEKMRARSASPELQDEE